MGVVKSRGIRMAQHVESTERESPFVGCREYRRLHIDGNGYHRMEPGGDAHRRDPVRAQPLDQCLPAASIKLSTASDVLVLGAGLDHVGQGKLIDDARIRFAHSLGPHHS